MGDGDVERATLLVRADEWVDCERSPKFLRLRRLAVRVQGEGREPSEEGTWDFVERPHGLDAVVVVIHRRVASGIEVLLRRGLRVPAAVGRPGQARGPGVHAAVFVEEVVAGIVELGEVREEDLAARARHEVAEETGLELPQSAFSRLGGTLWATPGLCAEVLHYFAADATGAAEPKPPAGDGSPFETLSSIAWHPLAIAIDRVCGVGNDGSDPRSLGDLRAELGLRRLEALLGP